MRKLILIATMSLLASQAYAGGPRSLSLAATNSSQQATEQPAAPTQAATAPAATPAQPTAETAKPKRRQPSTEARVIRELHRHGIYW